MHPVLFTFNFMGTEILVGTYALCLLLAIVAGILVAMIAGHNKGYKAKDCGIYYAIAACGALVGGSVIGFFLSIDLRLQGLIAMRSLYLVSWGGIIGAIIALLLMSRAWFIDFFKIADIFAPSFLISMSIGRIGCHFAGCCYGISGKWPLAITFVDPLAPASLRAQPLFPVQITSSMCLFILFIIIFKLLNKAYADGIIFSYALIGYAFYRYNIEFLRDDMRIFVGGLSDGQVFSLLLLFCAFFCIIYIWNFSGRRKNNNNSLICYAKI